MDVKKYSVILLKMRAIMKFFKSVYFVYIICSMDNNNDRRECCEYVYTNIIITSDSE